MDDYVCITLRSRPGESEEEFKDRIAQFWTHMVRNRPDDYEKMYAEATAFEREGSVLMRQYMLEAAAADVLESELKARGFDFDPIDRDECYSKYEAAPPEWFWIEH